ncbi:hypothetical protein QBC39DRAFT_374906 [Podospora conica]|nr:hypothetical protein QBC39DRAFT_374906 [Schizothecium conicum]
MAFGVYNGYAPCRLLSSSSSSTSFTPLGAVNSELYSFRSKLAGLQPEADTDNDEVFGMFDDASCIFVEKLQTPTQPSTLMIPGISPMERTVIYHFPSIPFIPVPSTDPDPDHHKSDSLGPRSSDAELVRSTNPTPSMELTTTARPPITKRSPSASISPYRRKRARTITDDDADDSDWVFPEIPAAPVREQKPTFVLVLRRARTAAARNVLGLQKKCNVAELQKKCRAAVKNEYQYFNMARMYATGGYAQAREPGPKTKCFVVGGGGDY